MVNLGALSTRPMCIFSKVRRLNRYIFSYLELGAFNSFLTGLFHSLFDNLVCLNRDIKQKKVQKTKNTTTTKKIDFALKISEKT